MIDEKLYSLIKVYECGSFSEAARQLTLTQPAVSHHIKLLEEELNVRIFERISGRISLTKEGETVIRYAKKMLGLYSNMKRDIEDSKSRIDHIIVGVTHTAESNPIAEALAKYGAENEDIAIKIVTDKINNLYNMLKTYEIDLAVTEGRVSDPSIHYMLLDTDYLVLAVSPNHPFAMRGMVNINEIRREKLILRLPGSNTRNLLDAYIESNRLSIQDFNVVLEVDNVATIKDLIRRDFGISILPRSSCLDEVKKKKIVIVPVENLSIVRETNIAYLNEFERPDILNEIIRYYHEILRSYT